MIRRLVLTALVMLLIVGAIATLSIEGSRRNESTDHTVTLPLQATARADARAFLERYEASSGRVVRKDQGGDTVSEGQSYAMLLAVAIGERHQFAAAWRWEQTNLQLPDGLFAYHWSGGKVVNAEPATDADLDTAWALVHAGRRFNNSHYRAQGLRVASAVLSDETTVVAGSLAVGGWTLGPVQPGCRRSELLLSGRHGRAGRRRRAIHGGPSWPPIPRRSSPR